MASETAKRNDPATALRGFLLLEGCLRLFIWYNSISLTVALFNAMNWWPQQPIMGGDLRAAWTWGRTAGGWVVIYNLAYVVHLLILRAIVPSPKEGTYAFSPDKLRDIRILWAALVGVLVKARVQAPFPAFLVFHLWNLPPLCWIVKYVYGPRSRSVLVLDPMMPDPHLTEIGRNVVVGNMTSIICHTQYRDHVDLRKTVIEDDVMIGAHALIYSGCTIRRGAVVYGGSIVRPNTEIGENEAWGGVPARKLRDLPPVE